MSTWRHVAGVSLILLLAVSACSGTGPGETRGIDEGVRAREFSLKSLAGDEVSLSDYEGDVVLINFWATWCGPCQAEIPDLETAYRERRDEGFVVLGISVQESPQAVKEFVAETEMTYPVLLDPNGRLFKEYRASKLPTSLILDREGVIRTRYAGYLPASELETYLEQVLP